MATLSSLHSRRKKKSSKLKRMHYNGITFHSRNKFSINLHRAHTTSSVVLCIFIVQGESKYDPPLVNFFEKLPSYASHIYQKENKNIINNCFTLIGEYICSCKVDVTLLFACYLT